MTETPGAAVTPAEYLMGLRQGYADRNGEVSLLNAVIREMQTERTQILAAMRELLSGHDKLYSAHFAFLTDCDPANDIAAKAARVILDGEQP